MKTVLFYNFSSRGVSQTAVFSRAHISDVYKFLPGPQTEDYWQISRGFISSSQSKVGAGNWEPGGQTQEADYVLDQTDTSEAVSPHLVFELH